MLATVALVRYCSSPNVALRLRRGRGRIGAGPRERTGLAVDDLPCPNENPPTGRGLAELVDVKIRDSRACSSPCLIGYLRNKLRWVHYEACASDNS
jgi:hypothetical protein